MIVFSDVHHRDLWHSLEMLFESRLKWELYCPLGLEWYTEGLWSVYPSLDTAKQYLERNDTGHGITLDQFKEMTVDIVIASIPQHIEPYKKLAQMKGAKFIFQMGNEFTEVLNNLHEIPNLMASIKERPVNTHSVFYRQEFDLNIFKPLNLPPQRQITSFINVYQNNGGFEDYLIFKSRMLDFEFKSYGGQCQDGTIDTVEEIATIMNRSAYGFHSKRGGDGYGHILYNWFACGKPVITRISDYKGKLGEELLEHEVTCFDLDKMDYNALQYTISNLSPTKYEYMCNQVYERFTSKVDFDQEEQKIRNFLENLI